MNEKRSRAKRISKKLIYHFPSPGQFLQTSWNNSNHLLTSPPQQYPITHSSLKQARLDSKRTILPKQYLIPIVPRAPTLSATPVYPTSHTDPPTTHTRIHIHPIRFRGKESKDRGVQLIQFPLPRSRSRHTDRSHDDTWPTCPARSLIPEKYGRCDRGPWKEGDVSLLGECGDRVAERDSQAELSRSKDRLQDRPCALRFVALHADESRSQLIEGILGNVEGLKRNFANRGYNYKDWNEKVVCLEE